MTSHSLDARQVKPSVLADVVPGTTARDALLIVAGAVFVGLLAQISIHLSFTPVPITGQTLGVLLTGTALGWRRGAAAMMLYALAGVVGIPWFAEHTSGYVGPSFGYILGFIVCALVCGGLAEHGAGRNVGGSVIAMAIGEVVMYAIGVAWLGIYLRVGVSQAISLGLTPFIWGDVIKATIAALLLPAAWKLIGSRR